MSQFFKFFSFISILLKLLCFDPKFQFYHVSIFKSWEIKEKIIKNGESSQVTGFLPPITLILVSIDLILIKKKHNGGDLYL